MALSAARKGFLMDLLSVPTAPFREHLVREFAVARLEEAGVPWCVDAAGNLLAGVESEQAARRLVRGADEEPVRLYIAHMDHPGFHGAAWRDSRHLRIRWHGGSPVKHLAGARVWIADAEGHVGFGHLTRCRLAGSGRWLESAEVRFADRELYRRYRAAKRLFGGFAFRKPAWQQGQRIYTKAADDLAGVFCVLETACHVFGRRRGERIPFVGLLTRAEEVGFVGAVAHLEQGWWHGRRRVVAISLEASRTLPGARVGRGPVVRLGDRRTVFDADASQVLTALAEKLLPGRYQRRLMDGGACEGTATVAAGLPTIALSVPLGNYHNQGFDGGADCPKPLGPAPEFVSVRDLEDQLTLCLGLMRRGLGWADPWRDVTRKLVKNRRKYGALLRE